MGKLCEELIFTLALSHAMSIILCLTTPIQLDIAQALPCTQTICIWLRNFLQYKTEVPENVLLYRYNHSSMLEYFIIRSILDYHRSYLQGTYVGGCYKSFCRFS